MPPSWNAPGCRIAKMVTTRSSCIAPKREFPSMWSSRPARLEQERFECCAIKLVTGCEPFLREFRTSPVNRNAVLIGLQPTNSEPDPYWKYGLNAVAQLPLKLDESLELLRTSCLLTVRQIGRASSRES